MRRTQEAIDTSNLTPLTLLEDFEVASGETDVRGWDVVARDGKEIGDVDDLLVDRTARRVRYLSVALDRSLIAELVGHSGHVMIPVEEVRLDDCNNKVHLENVSSTEVNSLPSADAGTFGPR